MKALREEGWNRRPRADSMGAAEAGLLGAAVAAFVALCPFGARADSSADLSQATRLLAEVSPDQSPEAAKVAAYEGQQALMGARAGAPAPATSVAGAKGRNAAILNAASRGSVTIGAAPRSSIPTPQSPMKGTSARRRILDLLPAAGGSALSLAPALAVGGANNVGLGMFYGVIFAIFMGMAFFIMASGGRGKSS